MQPRHLLSQKQAPHLQAQPAAANLAGGQLAGSPVLKPLACLNRTLPATLLKLGVFIK
jgi:hypothetical protein